MPINRGIIMTITGGGVATGNLEGAKFTFTQITPSATWNINHNLGTTALQVQVFDATGKAIGWDEITFVDDDNVTITFTATQAGKAVID